MHELPQVITHNYDPERGALQNLCGLPLAEAEAILEQIRAAGLARLRHSYLERRLQTEKWLSSERLRKLGPTPLSCPIYFFLGDFADGLDPARPASLVIPLAALPPETLTFTWSDSMASHRGEGPWGGAVFTLSEITQIVRQHGMPSATPDAGRRPFIEVQVWDDRPLQAFRPLRAAIA